MGPSQRERNQEKVTVFGPVDTAPGKKMVYKTRLMDRGLAEKQSVKNLGIQIIEGVGAGKRVEVRHTQTVEVEGMDPRDQRIADLEAQMKALFEAMQNKKGGRSRKIKTDADQA